MTMDAETLHARLIGRTGLARGIDRAVDETITLGSAADNGLAIDALSVSRQHARVSRQGDGYQVEDLGSANGTFLNGRRVNTFPIRNLDVLSLGPEIDLIFLQAAERPALSPQRSFPLYASILWVEGPFAGTLEEVTPERPLVLGRGSAAELADAVSRHHASLEIRGTTVMIEDLGSANGTWVNGTRISGATALADGDRVRLANVLGFTVSLSSAGARPDRRRNDATAATRALPAQAKGAPTLNMLAPAAPAATIPPVPASPSTPAPLAGAEPPMPSSAEPARDSAPVEPPDSSKDSRAVAKDDPDLATVLAPREAAAAPRLGPIPAVPPSPSSVANANAAGPEVAAGADEEAGGETRFQPREPSAGIPGAVVADANAARVQGSETAFKPPAPLPTGPEPQRPPVAPAPASPDPGAVVVGVKLAGPQEHILNRGVFIVGRDPLADVAVESPDVGRRHARLRIREDGVFVEDLATVNGTFVDGVRISSDVWLADNAVVRFATIDFHVSYVRKTG